MLHVAKFFDFLYELYIVTAPKLNVDLFYVIQ